MAVIGEGTALVALQPGALEALVSNMRAGFAPAAHSHGASGIEDGAVTYAKLSADAVAALAPPAPYDVLFEDADGSSASRVPLSAAVLGEGREPYLRLVLHLVADTDGTPWAAAACVPAGPGWRSASSVKALLPVSIASSGGLRTHFGNATIRASEIGWGQEIQVGLDASTGALTATSTAARTVRVTRVEGWRV